MNDECESQKAAVEERCLNQSVELEKAAAWVRDLESQLVSIDLVGNSGTVYTIYNYTLCTQDYIVTTYASGMNTGICDSLEVNIGCLNYFCITVYSTDVFEKKLSCL